MTSVVLYSLTQFSVKFNLYCDKIFIENNQALI